MPLDLHHPTLAWLYADLARSHPALLPELSGPTTQLPSAPVLPSAERDAPPYERHMLCQLEHTEVLLMTWRVGRPSAIHDHGGGSGDVYVLSGTLVEQRWLNEAALREQHAPQVYQHAARTKFLVTARDFHSMVCLGPIPAQTLHVYQHVSSAMRLVDLDRRMTVCVPASHGAWAPTADAVLSEETWR